MRPIDADALKEAILEERKYIREEECEIKKGFMLAGLRRALRCLEEAPTVERPRGEWIMHDDEILGLSCECSACHIETLGNSNCASVSARLSWLTPSPAHLLPVRTWMLPAL